MCDAYVLIFCSLRVKLSRIFHGRLKNETKDSLISISSLSQFTPMLTWKSVAQTSFVVQRMKSLN